MTRCSVRFGITTLLASTACQSQPPPPPAPIAWPEREAPSPAPAVAAASAAQTRQAEELAKTSWTLDDALEVTEAVNPVLVIERGNVDLATVAIWESRLYPNPELLLGVEDYRTRDGLTLSHAKRTLGIGMPLVIGGRIGAATSAAEAERAAAAVRFVWRRREILGAVKQAFVEVLAARKSLELIRETRDIARTFRDTTDERFRAQAIPEMEVLKAAVNLAKADSDVMIAEKRLAVAQHALLAAIGKQDLPVRPLVGELSVHFAAPDFDALRDQVAESHPLIEEAMRSRAAAEREIELARAERIPDLGLQIEAGRDSEDAGIVQAFLSVPIGVFNRNQAKLASASIRLDQSQQRIAATLNDLLFRIDGISREFTAAQQRVDSYEMEVLPKAERALDQTNEGHRLGKFTFLDVLDAQRTLVEAKIAYVEAVAALNLAVAELETLMGVTLH